MRFPSQSGTAIGEIPPYAISRAASLAGEANKEFEEIQSTKSDWAFMDRMKMWMIDFLKKHGNSLLISSHRCRLLWYHLNGCLAQRSVRFMRYLLRSLSHALLGILLGHLDWEGTH